MMRILYILYTAAICTAVVPLAAVVLDRLLQRRRRSRDRQLCGCSIRQIVAAQLSDRAAEVPLPLGRAVGRRRLLAELLSELVSATYGLDTAPVRRIVERYGLDRWLLRRIRFSRGCRRARYLKWLADLPVGGPARDAAERYLADPCREVRFCALLVRIVAAPEEALRAIAGFGAALTDGEVAEVRHLRRRGLLPIAYRPLVEASDANLRRLGLAIVGQFGVEEAEPELLHIVASDEAALSAAALRVLASMHRPMRRREVIARVRRMVPAERHALLRLLAREEYAPRSVRVLLDAAEQPYYESLVGSYKRQLVWR